MTRTLVLLLSLTTVSFILIGCSSTPTPNPDPYPYCATEESVTLTNGDTNNSVVKLECSDNPLVRAEKFYGIDQKNCRLWEKQISINGLIKTTSGVLCKDENGNYRPLSQY